MATNTTKLLLEEHPLIILPRLASKIGLNESLILQQIHYWLNINEKANNNRYDGYYWVFNSYTQWQEQFPFWSSKTIERSIKNLEKLKLLIIGNYNTLKIDRTKWYTINYKVLEALEQSPFSQIGVTNTADWVDHLVKLGLPLPKTTTKTTRKDFKRIGRFSLDGKTQYISFQEFSDKTDITGYELNIKAVEYYLKKYEQTKGKKHPKCTWQEWCDVITSIFDNEVIEELKEYYIEDDPLIEDLIDHHFTKTYKSNKHDIRSFKKFTDNHAYEIAY